LFNGKAILQTTEGRLHYRVAFLFSKQRSKAVHECEICGNVFEIEWIAKGKDYNDFGYRYCPFCGAMFDTVIIDQTP